MHGILFKLKYPEGFKCTKYETTHYYYIGSRDVYECKECRHQISLNANTAMENIHLSYHTWLLAIYFLLGDMMSIKKLKDKLGVS